MKIQAYFNIKNRVFFLKFFLIYTAAHFGLLLIYDGVFWDDWTLFNSDSNTILKTFYESGAFLNLNGYTHVLLLGIGVWVYKLLTFIFMFISGCFLFLILKRQSWLNEQVSFLLVIIFLVFPVNSGRVTIICFPYTLSFFLFFCAWYIMFRQKWLSTILFFLSFNTQSFLVFFFLPLLELVINHSTNCYNFRDVLKLSIRYLHFLLLPFLFWILKSTFFKPTGLFAGYNEQFSFSNLIYAPKPMISDVLELRMSFSVLILTIILFLLLLKFSVPILGIANLLQKGHKPIIPSKFFWTGCVSLFVAVFPYWILGYSPTFNEWTSRHQLLMPFGLAFFVIWVFSILPKSRGKILLLAIISLSISINIITYRNFFNDIRKQKTLISFLSKNNAVVVNSDVIVIEDETPKAISRKYRFYELTGMMDLATNSMSRFALPSESDFFKYTNGDYDKMFTKIYHASEHVRKPEPIMKKLLIKFEQQNLFLPNVYSISE